MNEHLFGPSPTNFIGDFNYPVQILGATMGDRLGKAKKDVEESVEVDNVNGSEFTDELPNREEAEGEAGPELKHNDLAKIIQRWKVECPDEEDVSDAVCQCKRCSKASTREEKCRHKTEVWSKRAHWNELHQKIYKLYVDIFSHQPMDTDNVFDVVAKKKEILGYLNLEDMAKLDCQTQELIDYSVDLFVNNLQLLIDDFVLAAREELLHLLTEDKMQLCLIVLLNRYELFKLLADVLAKTAFVSLGSCFGTNSTPGYSGWNLVSIYVFHSRILADPAVCKPLYQYLEVLNDPAFVHSQKYEFYCTLTNRYLQLDEEMNAVMKAWEDAKNNIPAFNENLCLKKDFFMPQIREHLKANPSSRHKDDILDCPGCHERLCFCIDCTVTHFPKCVEKKVEDSNADIPCCKGSESLNSLLANMLLHDDVEPEDEVMEKEVFTQKQEDGKTSLPVGGGVPTVRSVSLPPTTSPEEIKKASKVPESKVSTPGSQPCQENGTRSLGTQSHVSTATTKTGQGCGQQGHQGSCLHHHHHESNQQMKPCNQGKKSQPAAPAHKNGTDQMTSESNSNHSDDDSSSSATSVTEDVKMNGKHCNCYYCEMFGHAGPQPTSRDRNVVEIRERLRQLLSRKREVKSSNSPSANVPLNHKPSPASSLSSPTPSFSTKDPVFMKHPTHDPRNVDTLVDYILGHKDSKALAVCDEKKAAKKARQKLRKQEERRLMEEEKARIRAREEAERLERERLEQERKEAEAQRLRELRREKKKKKKKAQQAARQENLLPNGIANDMTVTVVNSHHDAANLAPFRHLRYSVSPQRIRDPGTLHLPVKSSRNQSQQFPVVPQFVATPQPTTQGSSNSQMVTIKRVSPSSNTEPTVTVTLKGHTPNEDRVLFKLVNGQVKDASDDEERDASQPKSSKKKKKKNGKIDDCPVSPAVLPNQSPVKRTPSEAATFALEHLRIPPGITITRLDGPAPQPVQQVQSRPHVAQSRGNFSVPGATITSVAAVAPSVIVVDTEKLRHQRDREKAANLVPSCDVVLEPSSSKKKKRKNKNKDAAPSLAPPVQTEPSKPKKQHQQTQGQRAPQTAYEVKKQADSKTKKTASKPSSKAPGKQEKAVESRATVARSQVASTRSQAPATRVQAPSTRVQAPPTRAQASSTRSQAPPSRVVVSSRCCRLPTQAPPTRPQPPGPPRVPPIYNQVAQPRSQVATMHSQPAAPKKKPVQGKCVGSASRRCDWHPVDSDIFQPKDIDLDTGEIDEEEKELELFKRFCLNSVPLAQKEKVKLNIKDLVMKKKNSVVF